jgi:uncharacterized protein YuzE
MVKNKLRVEDIGGDPITEVTFSFDTEAQAVYIRVRDGKVHRTLEPEPEVFVDVDKDNHLLGIEILSPVGQVEILHRLAKEYHEPVLDVVDPVRVNKLFAASSK